MTTTVLALLVIEGLAAGGYAKSEGANSLLAAIVGVATSVITWVLTR